MNKILSGHISPETAFLVPSYPYGFNLRCRIRYWLEHHPKRGTRLVSQTSNPKRGDVWNKPKASTYQVFGGCMILNDEGHVTWTGLTEYDNCAQLVAWRDAYAHTLPDNMAQRLKAWITRKLAYEQSKAEGLVKCTMTTKQYGCVSDPDFGKLTAPVTVETTVLTSDYTPAQLMEMGQTLRGDTGAQVARFATA